MTSDSLTGDERDLVEKITRHNLAVLPEPERGPDGREFIGRAQHGKHHGCVRSTFTVAPDLPEQLRHGVFAEPGKAFAALVRFSNGRAKDDSEADAHGMAIKLLDVAGARLAGQEWQTTQDFVLVDDELFFSGDLGQYEEINRLVAEAKESILAKLSLTPAVKLITALRLKGVGDGEVLDAVRDFAGQKPASPLATHYWSTTPYRLGEAVVKYMAVSRRALEQRPEQVGENYLAEALKQELVTAGASFDFCVHIQGDERLQPIDEPGVSWSRNGAACVRLATLEIPQQKVRPDASLAEQMVFSPWNCLAAHEPIGKINLARGNVYAALAKERHGRDEQKRRQWANVPGDQRP